jgi:hypothetical protein
MSRLANPSLLTTLSTALIGSLLAASVSAKLPAPSDEAKAKAAEAAAKTAHAGKVDGYKLCQSMDQVAASYHASAKKAGKEVRPPMATPPCTDPGAFVYAPPAPAGASAPVVAAAATAPAAPAAPAAPVKK